MTRERKVRLTEPEIETFRRDGMVIPEFRLGDGLLDRMRQALASLQRDNPQLSSDVIVCPHLMNSGTQNLKGSADWLEFACHSDILDMVEQLIGPDIILWCTTVFGKPAGTGKETPWHQDAKYWPIRPPATCSVWIALDDSTPANGCLRIIPGSHLARQFLRHNPKDYGNYTLNLELDPTAFRESDARDVVLAAGQISLYDVFMVHGSKPNRSAQWRAGFVLRLMPATSLWDRELGARLSEEQGIVDFKNRLLYLVRGTDRTGRNEAVVPDSDAA